MSTTATSINWSKVTSDLLFLAPLVSALAGFDWSGLVPGTPGLVTAVAVGAFAKTLAGFAQDPRMANWEDLVGFAAIFLGFLSSAFTANPAFVEWGTIFGLLAKALGFFQSGFNIEDALLAIGVLIAGYGTLTGNMQLFNAGALIGLFGKSLPSIATSGTSGNPKASSATPPSTQP